MAGPLMVGPPRNPEFVAGGRAATIGRRAGWVLARLALGGFVVGLLLPERQADAAEPAGVLRARERMVQEAVVNTGVTNRRVIEAMATTPRHEFVPSALRGRAYDDTALAIGGDQTISSPSIVSAMTEALDPQPTDRVLEIGTGSGYQAAVLSGLVQDVYTIEIVESLGKQATATLKRLGYKNVQTRVGDGFLGWPEAAPFDKIIVTCSPENVPQPLVDQLREGGMMIIPVGERYQQVLTSMTKTNGELVETRLRPTLFVPMTGEAEARRGIKPDVTRIDLVNPSFDEPLDQDGFLPGWYYQRGATVESGSATPDGRSYLRLATTDLAQPAMLLQGLALDGRHIQEVELSALVRHANLIPDRGAPAAGMIELALYDNKRREIGTLILGSFRGTRDWRPETVRSRIPADTREAILKLGLFRGTGQMDIDAVRLAPIGSARRTKTGPARNQD